MGIFLYGTLLHRGLLAAVVGPDAQGGIPANIHCRPARLADHAVRRVAGETGPMLMAEPGAQVQGTVCTGMTALQQSRLDAYLGAFGGASRRVTVSVTDAEARTVTASAHYPPEGQVSSGDAWCREVWEAGALQPALLAAQELLEHDPPLSAQALAAQWLMIERRAHARHRARTETTAPATMRHRAQPDDARLTRSAPLQGRFFKLSGVDVNHLTFRGGRSDDLKREVLLGIDAALVLPYDAARDRLLLVEQFRMGPMQRHDPNPWCLEPVAGMIDPRETPEAAAVRETEEEAGLVLARLERMFAFYASPGSSTDYFFCYLGPCDLPDSDVYTGGLASEAEDLRLHTLGFERAMGMLDSGEINAGPLVAMLLWLARHRERLRGAA
jgi:ADP-ribose pyrophosphatase